MRVCSVFHPSLPQGLTSSHYSRHACVRNHGHWLWATPFPPLVASYLLRNLFFFVSFPFFQTANLGLVFKESAPTTPLIFVLSPGTDPAADLYKFAEEMKFSKKLSAISLGQGQVRAQFDVLSNKNLPYYLHSSNSVLFVWRMLGSGNLRLIMTRVLLKFTHSFTCLSLEFDPCGCESCSSPNHCFSMAYSLCRHSLPTSCLVSLFHSHSLRSEILSNVTRLIFIVNSFLPDLESKALLSLNEL